MGDYILMKNLYFVLLLFLSTQLFSNKLAWVDEQIEAIKPERIGVSNNEISKVKSPFIFLEKADDSTVKQNTKGVKSPYAKYKTVVKRKSSIYFRLEAIVNKSAMINGKWYKEGKYIYGYKLSKVNRTFVVLIRKNKRIRLSTASRNKHIKFKNK